MSTRMMGLCWPLKLSPPAKAVLISLADQANDEGVCWPSVGTIETRTCFDDRTIQRAFVELQEAGHLTVQRREGRSTVYHLHPRHSDGGDAATPPSQRHPTPVTVTPHPRHSDTQNRKGTVKGTSPPSEGSRAGAREGGKAEVKPPITTCPEGVEPQDWADWMLARKAKKAGVVTFNAWQCLLREAVKAGIPPGEAVRYCAERQWQGFHADLYLQAGARSAPSLGRKPTLAEEGKARLDALERHFSQREEVDVTPGRPANPKPLQLRGLFDDEVSDV